MPHARAMVVAGVLMGLLSTPWAQTSGPTPAHRLPMPDIPGYVTLKGDFHLHSVFSDGEVWPTIHVREAWNDGLDVVSLTEHIEYRPHKADVAGNAQRAFEVAGPVAASLGMLLVPGAEITRPVPGSKSEWPVGSAHFNVLFPTDFGALETPELTEALTRARAQGAFVFWNHPGFMDRPAAWFPHVAAAFDAGLFGGIEVVNGDRFYPEALQWAHERHLTPLACSDAHLPMPAHLKSARRPITLLFAKTRDLEGIKDALVSGRTLAWLDRNIWGDARWLAALWGASASVAPVRATAASDVDLVIQNTSALDFDIQPGAGPAWLRLSPATLTAATATVVHATLAADAPAGAHAVDLEVQVANLQAEAGIPLPARLALSITIGPHP